MNQNIELLNYIYEDAYMGVETITTLSNTIKEKDNKIKKAIEDIIKGHEDILKESKKLLEKHKVELKEPSPMAKMGAWIGIKTEMMKDNSDSRIADMITKGLTMGLLDITKKIEAFDENTDSKVKKIAKNLKVFEEESIELLKPYL